MYLRSTKLQNLYKIDIKVLSLLAVKVLLMIIENKIKNVEEIIKKYEECLKKKKEIIFIAIGSAQN